MIVRSAVLAALLVSTSAFAQAPAQPGPTGPTTGDAATQTPVSDPASDDAPGEIVVTAQKREQSLQDVSLAVTAVGQDRLATSQVNNLQDLQSVVPAVNFGQDFNQAKIFIRGVGANTSTTGSSTGVALHVDGAYVARAEAQLTSLFDLERVEVLRGPQGTLYGRNAVGGSVNLITARPTRDFSGYARVTYGNYNALQSEVAISGPVTDTIRLRLAAKTEDRDGFGENPTLGREIDDLKRRMIRGQAEFDIGSRADLLLSAEYFRQDDASGALHFLRASFPGVARLAPLGVGGYAAKPRDLATEGQTGTDTESYAFTSTLRYELSDAVTLTNLANYRRFKSSLFQDLDLSSVIDSLATNGQATTFQERRINSKQWSNELQLNYDSRFVTGVLGGYYFGERQRPIDTVGLGPRTGQASNIPVLRAAGINLAESYFLCGYEQTSNNAPKRVCTRSSLGTRAFAAFGQVNLNGGLLGDGLSAFSLKLGGRYSNERAESANPSIVITRNGLGPVIRSSFEATYRRRTFKDFTPELGLEWKPSRDLLVYYTYSEGFKAGSGENSSGSTTIVDPETIKNHEAGIKATVLDRHLSINLAGYSYKLDGLQLNKTIAGGPTGYQTIFQNAASTEAKGFELEMFGRVTREIRFSGAVSYTDAHFSDYLTLDPLAPQNIAGGTPYNAVTNPDPTGFGAPGGGNIQLAGNDLRNSPRWSWNMHGEYDLPVNPFGGQLTWTGDVTHKSRTYFTEFERDIESSRAYTMVDGTLSFLSANRQLKVSAFVKNLFDTFRASSTFALATGRLLGASWLPPRTYGVSVGYNF